MRNSFSSISKYLINGIEYSLDFYADHLVKLDPDFNAEITIYDDEGFNLKINSKNPTAKINGYNLKIKSNNNTMVYFYGKNTFDFSQSKIDIEQRKNIEIKMKKNAIYILDLDLKDTYLQIYLI